ncbi:MAG: hypothetical protein MH132_00320 [Hydrotalea sp.]|nr:hypothetical protein [Hydrotalea sp.]
MQNLKLYLILLFLLLISFLVRGQNPEAGGMMPLKDLYLKDYFSPTHDYPLPGFEETNPVSIIEKLLEPMIQAEGLPSLPGGGSVNDVPIDGGLSALLIAGVGYGARKLRRRKVPENREK